jgi:2',3'-cyclic-nucleotide 2'-phosphodiesterase (5'-nucleotidase family)
MNQIIFIIACALIFVKVSAAQTESVVVVYSHNTNGVFENCDCPERSYGALEKRAAVIDSIRKSDENILLLDTGDILDIQPSLLLHSYVVKAYDYLNYDFWTPGDQDFVEGSDFFLNKLSRISASMVNTNIFYRDNPIGQSAVIKKIGGITVGITGTIRDDLHKYLDAPADADFKFKDQFASLSPVISELSEKTDFIILLSHSGIERDQLIAQKFPSINLIIGGHSQTILAEPKKVGSTYISQVGESGYRLGIFRVLFKNNKIYQIENSVILLNRNMPDDPAVVKMIKNYHQERLQD